MIRREVQLPPCCFEDKTVRHISGLRAERLNTLPDTTKGEIMPERSGLPAADFTLPDATGTMHTLQEFHGHWLLMVFHRHLG